MIDENPQKVNLKLLLTSQPSVFFTKLPESSIVSLFEPIVLG